MVVDTAMRNVKRASDDGDTTLRCLGPPLRAATVTGRKDQFCSYSHTYRCRIFALLLIILSCTCTHAMPNPKPVVKAPRAVLSPPDEAATKKNNGGLSSGELIGIILASVFGSVLMLFIIIWGWHKVKHHRGEKVEREYAEEMRAAVETGRRSRLIAEGVNGGFSGEEDVARLGGKDLGIGGAERYVVSVKDAGERRQLEPGIR